MKKLIILAITACILAGILYATYGTRRVSVGAWTEGLYDPVHKTLHPEVLERFEKLIGKHVSIAHYYRGWESLADPGLITEFATLRARGWEPMLNVNPYFFSQCSAGGKTLYRAIADGQCDQFLHAAGRNLKNVKKPFYLLFAWEMNNPALEWSIVRTGSKPVDFIAAWRRIHTIFKQEKATNIIWVFAPNTQDASVSYDRVFPGSSYVDWVGLDGYNWGTTQPWSHWQSFAEVFSASYGQLIRLAPDKPMMLAEVNTTDQGGDKGAWYVEMFTKQIPYNFLRIRAVVVYNEDRTRTEHVNWKVDITPESLKGFTTGISNRIY